MLEYELNDTNHFNIYKLPGLYICVTGTYVYIGISCFVSNQLAGAFFFVLPRREFTENNMKIKEIADVARLRHDIEATNANELMQRLTGKLAGLPANSHERADIEKLLNSLFVASRLRQDGTVDTSLEDSFEVSND